MGKDVDELLEKRGASRISPLGLGDDDGMLYLLHKKMILLLPYMD